MAMSTFTGYGVAGVALTVVINFARVWLYRVCSKTKEMQCYALN